MSRLLATFHKTAVVALPLVALANERGRVAGLLIAATATYLFYQFFLSASVGRLVTNYIDARYAAEGAGIRVAMSILPAALFLIRSRSLGYSERERRVAGATCRSRRSGFCSCWSWSDRARRSTGSRSTPSRSRSRFCRGRAASS